MSGSVMMMVWRGGLFDGGAPRQVVWWGYFGDVGVVAVISKRVVHTTCTRLA